MLNLKSVDSFIESIEPHPYHPTINISLLFSARISVETRYIARMGVIGVLPFATYRNGDLLALRFSAGKPLDSWSVVRVSHIGEGCQTVCSRLSRLMPALMILDRDLPHQQALKVYKDKVLRYADWLYDKEGLTQALIHRLEDETADMFDPLPHLPFSYADPDSVRALFETQFELAKDDSNNLIAGWQKITQFDATYAPAQTMLFKALLAGDDDKAIQQTAWDVFMLNHALDNVYMLEKARDENLGWSSDNPIIVAAKMLLERGLPPLDEALAQLYLPVIEALAYDEDAYDGSAHLSAARKLLEQKQYELAYIACQNAIYWRNMSQEKAYPEATASALTIARAWKQPELVRVLELAQELESTVVQTEATVPANIVIPRDIELSPAAVENIQKLTVPDVAYMSGETILMYHYNRWHYFTLSYFGHTKAISTMAILTMQRLSNLIRGVKDEEIKLVTELPEYIQQELRWKVLADIEDYLFLVEKGYMSITGGPTTEDISNPQLERDKERELTREILKGGGGGWFNFWRTWDEIEAAFKERE